MKIFGVFILLFNLLLSQSYHTFNFEGLEREYYFYKPDNLDEDAPLIMGFHGYGGSAQSFINYTEFMNYADEYGFAICSPQGTIDDYNTSFWNVGYSFHDNEIVNDVGFVSELARFLQNEYDLSVDKTFCTGMSNGGDLSYLLACQASDIFSAAAPVAGCMMVNFYNECSPSNNISIFEIHGKDDDTTLWDGDIYDQDGWGPYLGTSTIIDFWVQQNQCVNYMLDTLQDVNTFDGSYIISHKYSNENNNRVWLYEIVNGGHDWPGVWGNMDIHATKEIWDFFELSFLDSTSMSNDSYSKNLNQYSLIQNYPNPFNGPTTIEFELLNSAYVSIKIFDLNGRMISELLDRKRFHAGKHNAIWSDFDYKGGVIASGVYLCRLTIDKINIIKKMTYIK
tara:strand:+ start:535 stop:1716 length:1182 start_codon:yes stop_codon:yes gene_type:complete